MFSRIWRIKTERLKRIPARTEENLAVVDTTHWLLTEDGEPLVTEDDEQFVEET